MGGTLEGEADRIRRDLFWPGDSPVPNCFLPHRHPSKHRYSPGCTGWHMVSSWSSWWLLAQGRAALLAECSAHRPPNTTVMKHIISKHYYAFAHVIGHVGW